MTPCTDCEDGACHRHRPTHTDMLAFAAAYDEDIRAEGRREMLWLMAVGAACLYALTDDWEMAAVAHEMRCYALGALVDTGDTRAREYMR